MAKLSLNRNLQVAKNRKSDEFYTQLTDIEKEMKYYRKHFENKIVFCNCDDPEHSYFWRFFDDFFDFFGLKKLIATHFEEKKPSYKLEIEAGNNRNKNNKIKPPRIPLKENGDFRSDECIELLKEADIVITNPPFSLFREYVAQLMEYNKKFLIIGNKNAITYKEIFKLLKEHKMWLGYGSPTYFLDKDGNLNSVGAKWFTNLKIDKFNEKFIYSKKYYGNESEYPKYDNYDAINVNKVKDIPMDYAGAMGVPITFMDKYNPKQFEILGNEYELNIDKGRGYVNGEKKYGRIFIKNKQL